MTTTIRATRQTPFTKIDPLREDLKLHAEVQTLGAWLAGQDPATITMSRVLTFAREEHADALLTRQPVQYYWVWDDEEKMWYQVCTDRGTVAFVPEGDTDPVHILIEISARY